MKHNSSHICIISGETVVGAEYQYKEDDFIADVRLTAEREDGDFIHLNLEVLKVLHTHFSSDISPETMEVSYNKTFNGAYSGMWRLYPPGEYVSLRQ